MENTAGRGGRGGRGGVRGGRGGRGQGDSGVGRGWSLTKKVKPKELRKQPRKVDFTGGGNSDAIRRLLRAI